MTTSFVPLPTQGRKEREHLYHWVSEEEDYVAGKFDDQRAEHDAALATYDLALWWERQILQYFDRAKMFLEGAKGASDAGDPEGARQLELRAQQAMCKAMMTSKGLCEASVRVFGPLPTPGLPSGDVTPWF